jgi:hypothetical protein
MLVTLVCLLLSAILIRKQEQSSTRSLLLLWKFSVRAHAVQL